MGEVLSHIVHFFGGPPPPNKTVEKIDDLIEKTKREQELLKKVEEQEEEKKKLEEQTASNEAKAREADEKLKEAVDKLKEAHEEADQAKERLRKRMTAEVCPSAEQVEQAKARFQFDENVFHLAIAGCAGSGKSSIVNAIRGLRNSDEGAAKTSSIECTSEIERYPDPKREYFVWYDIPGAGTLNVPAETYFNEQGLFIFDFIIVPVDSRFTETDVAILATCKQFGIPSFIVRSKADQHINNMMEDKDISKIEARELHVKETRSNFASNLKNAGLDENQKVYIISRRALADVIKGKTPEDIIDEKELVKDLLSSAVERYEKTPTLRERVISALKWWCMGSDKKLKEIEKDAE
jgi:GTP-binding protein EngB required for normal cell division